MKEKFQLSEGLPRFGEMRRGTQVFVFADEQAAAVYDNYSFYPDARARSWQLEAYSRISGRRLDRVCTHRGRFRSREDALAAAEEGVEYTKTIIAVKGRASYVGERSIGHQDPGATSAALTLASICRYLKG